MLWDNIESMENKTMRYYEIIAAEGDACTSPVMPTGPLTLKQAQRRAKRRTGIEKKIGDEQARSSKKLADLRAKLVE